MSDKKETSSSDSSEFWDSDLTDRRIELDWETKYPAAAIYQIWGEAAYIIAVMAICLYAVFYIVFFTDNDGILNDRPIFWGLLGAWAAGALGGCCNVIKWMYHLVAKRLWHQDRRLWRILSPILSGVVALFMTFLTTSGLFQFFDKSFIHQPLAVMGFSFLVGLFTDNALKKMAEIAAILFSVSDRITNKKEQHGKPPEEKPSETKGN
jgi:hypothetical protein